MCRRDIRAGAFHLLSVGAYLHLNRQQAHPHRSRMTTDTIGINQSRRCPACAPHLYPDRTRSAPTGFGRMAGPISTAPVRRPERRCAINRQWGWETLDCRVCPEWTWWRAQYELGTYQDPDQKNPRRELHPPVALHDRLPARTGPFRGVALPVLSPRSRCRPAELLGPHRDGADRRDGPARHERRASRAQPIQIPDPARRPGRLRPASEPARVQRRDGTRGPGRSGRRDQSQRPLAALPPQPRAGDELSDHRAPAPVGLRPAARRGRVARADSERRCGPPPRRSHAEPDCARARDRVGRRRPPRPGHAPHVRGMRASEPGGDGTRRRAARCGPSQDCQAVCPRPPLDPASDGRDGEGARHVALPDLPAVRDGGGVARYLARQRLAAVRAALENPLEHRSIGAIGEVYGFGSSALLSRAFRQAYGSSPRDYRASVVGG
ncbi:helix-turn-helix domain-containing protein [Methylobacterium sp. P31]